MRKSVTVRKYNDIAFFFNTLYKINYNTEVYDIDIRYITHMILGIKI